MKKSAWLKLTLIIVSIAMALSLFACGDPVEDDTTTTDAPEQTTEAPEQTTEKPEETTEAPEQTTEKPEETTEAPEQTTEKPEETTEAPEETTEPDPHEDLDIYFDAEELAKKAASGNCAAKIEIAKAEDGSSVKVTRKENFGDGFMMLLEGNTEVTGQYMVIKYRTDHMTAAELWANTVANGHDGGTANIQVTLVADEAWHIAVIDLASLKPEKVVAAEDGTYTVQWARFDFLNSAAAEGYMELAYVGYTDDAGVVLTIAAADGDKTAELYYVADGAKVKDTYYVSTGSTTPTLNDVCGYLALPEQLASAGSTGVGEKKVSEDGSYVNLPGSGAPDGWILAVSGNTAPGQYVVMKYRLNNSTFTSRAGFCSNVNPAPADGSNQVKASMPLNPDGEWHIAIYNMSAFCKDDQLLPNDAGEVIMNYWRIDFADNMAADASMDLAFVGVTSDPMGVLKAVKGLGDKTIDFSGTTDKVDTYYTSTGTTEPAASDLLTNYFDADALAALGIKDSAGELADGYFHAVGGAATTDIYFGAMNFTGVTGQYLVIKYRTNFANNDFEFFCSTEAASAAGGHNFRLKTSDGNIIADGEWQVVIVDLSTVNANNIKAAEDGTYSVQYIRFDVLNQKNETEEELYVDIAYVGLADSIKAAVGAAKATGDATALVVAKDEAGFVKNVYNTATGLIIVNGDATLGADVPSMGSEDHGYAWDQETATLTLSGLILNGTVTINGDATIVLTDGTVSTITGKDMGINCTGTLTIKGNGTLNVVTGQHTTAEAPEGTSVKGIKAANIVIESGNINITVGNEENTALIRNPAGISTGTLTVNGGNLNVALGTSSTFGVKGSFKNAIYTSVAYIQNGGNVVVKSGKTVVGEGASSKWQENVALYSDDVIAINGGTLDLTAGERVDADSGVYAAYYGKAEHITVAAGASSTANETNTAVTVVVPETLTIKAAAEMGAAMEHDTTTEVKYLITGVVEEVKHEVYGNMNIVDAEGNKIYVYGVYSADGTAKYEALEAKPVAGDTVTLLAVVGNYNGAQLKNAWLINLVPAAAEETPAE